MIVGLVASAAFLLAASLLLVAPRSAFGKAVQRRSFLSPRVVAAYFVLLGVTGITNTADLVWFPERPLLSGVAIALLISTVVCFGVLVTISQRRKSRGSPEPGGSDGSIREFFG